MARYRKKPVVIEAIQYDGLNLEEIRRFVGSSLVYHIFDAAWKAGACQPVVDMKIKTPEGEMQVGKGDYIIKGVHGEFYPCKPDIFKETYELANIADVVPKSEIEELEAECERQYEQAKADILANMADGGTSCHWCIDEHKAQAKAEVAREIFEEIEKHLTTGTTYYGHTIQTIGVAAFAELKKKYTGEET